MSRMDAAASAALNAQVIRPVFFVYLDVVGDPLRACTAEASLLPTGSGDPDLDGHVFDALNPTFVDIGPVAMKSGGSDSLTAQLSGLVGLDDDLLTVIGNPANWQGRPARLWRMIRDENGSQRGAIQHYYTGYMVSLDINGSADSQTINLTIESYLVAFSQASNRTYLDQDSFDPGDLSAKAAIAIANGISGNPLVNNTPAVDRGPNLGGSRNWNSFQ
ncbi:hypothetical protein CA234_03115 [Sphingomonas sp. ABOLE]|uniref:hypothetical protein n=1 Tax=Sphingomonas sp. ABOLE TaxID=1985878 RepID=UPI000F7F9C96|nr:hypothetical protein [Sphingomonas sp. ABOLE]RSV44420.1 hypothetical protein CA234_03115 [Sphingomonas sp. ABOLE]